MSDIKETLKNESYKEKWKKYKFPFLALMIAMALIVTFFFPELAVAYETPNQGDPGYAFYDLMLDKGLQGPIGFVAALWLLIDAGTTIGTNPKLAVLKALGGGALIQADSIATTLGYIVSGKSLEVASLINFLG